VKDRPGHDRRYAIDATKIKQEIGWQPKYDFETALKLTIDWYKRNTSWWKILKNRDFEDYYQKQYVTR
ncbi:GDP-mannose 4,6-dehydratase, partial [Candidatus Curtissbacteria bacterium]|nr:GDP-mannose 4,6-dehydratase [Candidatus Curtissbacteria bacterium]